MKKVLFFTHNLKGGGAEKTILNLVDYINNYVSDVEAYFCSCFPDDDIQKQHRNIIVLKHRTSPTMNIFFKLFTKIAQIIELRKMKKDLDICVSVSFLTCSDYMNLFSGIGERKISSVRNMESKFTHNNIEKWFLSFVWNKNNRLVSISQSVKLDLITHYHIAYDRIVTIFNPLPQLFLSNLSGSPTYEKCLSQNKHILVTAGRLTAQKGQWHLIKAISYLVNDLKYQNIKLFILGKGELEKTLKKLVQDNKLENNIFFEGFVDNPQYYISHADIFVFSSLCEGLGNVLVEALDCGAAIVSTDCPSGPRELLAPKTDSLYQTSEIEYAEYGILVPPFEICDIKYHENHEESSISNGEKMLGDAIKILLDNYELRKYYCEQALKRSKDFEITKIYSQWENVLFE